MQHNDFYWQFFRLQVALFQCQNHNWAFVVLLFQFALLSLPTNKWFDSQNVKFRRERRLPREPRVPLHSSNQAFGRPMSADAVQEGVIELVLFLGGWLWEQGLGV